ncbi:prolactin-releasing peptide [Ictidomys tridecemlineatus]
MDYKGERAATGPHCAARAAPHTEGDRSAVPSWCGIPRRGLVQEARGMKSLSGCFLCLLLLGLVLQGAASRAPQHSMEIRTPDINPAWYRGRGIRPVGRFGRRRAALRDVPRPGLQCWSTCLPLEGGAKYPQDG